MEEITEKKCAKCGLVKPVSEFYVDKTHGDGLSSQCKSCRKEYRDANKDKINKRAKEYRQRPEQRKKHAERQKQYRSESPEKVYATNKACCERVKMRFIEMYGGHCALCDPNDPDAWEPEFLSLDHVRGDGAEERKLGHNTYWCYQDAVKDGVPDFTKYRLLCHNHNGSLGHPRKPYEDLTPEGRAAREIKDFVIDGYGGKCACCGKTDRDFLQLDHVNGGGSKMSKEKNKMWHYRDARDRNFPPDYQVLCSNCNMSKHFGKGVCVHQRKKPSADVLTEGHDVTPTVHLMETVCEVPDK